MTSEILLKRLRSLAYKVVDLSGELPTSPQSKIISYQIIKSAFSAAANYRAACRGQSFKSFKAKLSIAFEEADETHFWLESISDLSMAPVDQLGPMLKEADELARILGKSRITAEKKVLPKS